MARKFDPFRFFSQHDPCPLYPVGGWVNPPPPPPAPLLSLVKPAPCGHYKRQEPSRKLKQTEGKLMEQLTDIELKKVCGGHSLQMTGGESKDSGTYQPNPNPASDPLPVTSDL